MSESIKAAVYELPIIEKDGGLYVSAILLYRKLKISTQYNHWIRRRITQYGFESGLDYRSDLTIRSDGKAGKRVTDFLLTFDMGKELAMLAFMVKNGFQKMEIIVLLGCGTMMINTILH